MKRWSSISLTIALLAGSMTSAGADHAPACFGRHATIVGTNGHDQLNGTDGVDVIVGQGGGDNINGMDGDDFLCGNGGNDDIDIPHGVEEGNDHPSGGQGPR